MTPRQIGMRLRQTRKAQGMSQYELAAKAKVSREYIRQLEAGRSDPTVGMLEKLAKALRVPVTDLLK
jgi:transcriptional regulator with XRE-family HTH domain